MLRLMNLSIFNGIRTLTIYVYILNTTEFQYFNGIRKYF